MVDAASSSTPVLRLGTCSSDPLTFTFERIEDPLRIFLANLDESGSMQGSLNENVLAFDQVAALLGGRADLVILHGFESDSRYDVFVTAQASERLRWSGTPRRPAETAPEPPPPKQGRLSSLRSAFGFAPTASSTATGAKPGKVAVSSKVALRPFKPRARCTMHPPLSGPDVVMHRAREILVSHSTGGSTCPKSHPFFLQELADCLDAASLDVELVVLNSSDGGLDGGPNSPLTQNIMTAMHRITARCRCFLAANVLVGSVGSPEALTFFSGDLEKYDNRLLFSTQASANGVLLLRDFEPQRLPLANDSTVQHTVQPSLVCWTVLEDDQLVTWHPEGTRDRPARVTARRAIPKPGGRRMLMNASVVPAFRDVTLERDGQEVFRIIARSLSDNPYLRETSRQALNDMLAPLERLLTTRSAVLAMLVSSEASSDVGVMRGRIEANTAAIRAVLDQEGLTPRERSSRVNALNNVRHLLKAELRTLREKLDQETLDRELGFLESHPNHWIVWLQPAIDELRGQLEQTQVDPGNAMAHLSTRIRTAKSVQDGVARSADRYLDRILAESRARRDYLLRKADPRDLEPFEAPGDWIADRCPISSKSLTEGLAAIPFVADRADLTSGNLMAGGQNVDRMPIDRGPMLSLSAVRELIWGELGQMASPYCVGGNWYNASIPVLLGPASKEGLRDLERAIGWLSTGTSAFVPQMAEAIPGALAVLLGEPGGNVDTSSQVQALLRTCALLPHYRSYPYVAGTSTFDETGTKQSLTAVWAQSVAEAAGAACLQNMGCITSLLARALAADEVDVDMVADDLFVWGCRNLARSILATQSTDGRGGVEGIQRLAALLHHAVELEGFPWEDFRNAEASTETHVVEPGGELSPTTLAWVLGPLLSVHWPALVSCPASEVTPRLNAVLSSMPATDQGRAMDELDGVFTRLDQALRAGQAIAEPWEGDAVPASGGRGPHVTLRTHQHFDDIFALESLRPRRFATPIPGLASAAARVRRLTKAGKTDWVPPPDAAVVENPSVWAFLESHSAFYPLRAWLRLVDARLVGQPALAALRASADVRPIGPLPRVFPRMAALEGGGMANVILLLRRAFAFVVVNANGYADNQWATSSLRMASAADVDAILGPRPEPVANPRIYSAMTPLDLSVNEEEWPRMDAHGYLPKARAIDGRGRLRRPPPRLEPAMLDGPDPLVCQRACAAMLADLSEHTPIIGGMHRNARAVLGAYPIDLQTLDADEQFKVLTEELLPILAGRVTREVVVPALFEHCIIAFQQLIALGGDTRRFQAAEPEAFLAAQAREIRRMATGD